MTELGNRLKEAREAKGLSLDDLQNITKIQKRYLVGIEEGNYAIMPGKFYVRAFIKQYAEAVDLSHEELFDVYKEDVPSVVSAELPEQLSRVKTRKNIPDSNSKVLDFIPKLLIGVFVLGVAGLLYYFLSTNAYQQTKQPLNTGIEPVKYDAENLEKKKENNKQTTPAKKDDEEIKDNDQDDATQSEEIEEEPEAPIQEVSVFSKSGADTTFELKNTDRFVLKLVSTGETWVNMKNGKGYSLFQGMLKKGATESQTIDYSKESEANLVIGNSANTEIYINDQKIDYAVPPTDEVLQNIVIRFIPKVE